MDAGDALSRPGVRVRLHVTRGGETHVGDLAELAPGDVVGRLSTAALQVDHPSVSEGHALVSLRDGAFWLLALRRRVAVDGVVRSEVRLLPGTRVALADDIDLVVEEVALPAQVPALEADGLPPVVLPSVCSVRARPRPTVVGRFDPDAPCALWTTGSAWRLRLGGEERTVAVGDTFEVDGTTFRVTTQRIDATGAGVTRVAGGVDPPLHLVASYDVVHIHREGEPVMSLHGVQARLLCELASFGGPTPWHLVAGEIWSDEADASSLRKRWDVAVSRLRARLREARIRADLLQADGRGTYALVLRPEDRLEDRS